MTARKAEVKVQQVSLASLMAYDGNAKKHDNRNVEAIANSIEEFGFRNPILAWHNENGIPEIVAGHGRAAAAKRLRMQTVPVVFVDDLSDAQRRMLTLADNQTTMMTGWDEAQLAQELDALSDVFSVEEFGFDFDAFAETPIVEEPEEKENDPFGRICVLAVFNLSDAEKAQRLADFASESGAEVTVGGAGHVEA